MIYVLDASAMLAYLGKEPGANVVDAYLADPGTTCYAHAVNLCEVYRRYVAASGRLPAEVAIGVLYGDGVTPREDLDQPFWQDVGDMVAVARATPKVDLSLADAFGFALARRLGCEFVSADHKLDPVLSLGLCPVRFIR